jgi:hypothetical protein
LIVFDALGSQVKFLGLFAPDKVFLGMVGTVGTTRMRMLREFLNIFARVPVPLNSRPSNEQVESQKKDG